jgi:Flp pilus assembly protein TadD
LPSQAALTAAACLAAADRALEDRDFAAAAAHFAEALELKHDDARAHNGLGHAYLKLGRDAEAADSFLLAAHFGPDHADPLYHLGLVSHRRGDPASAIDYLDRALAIQPGHAEAHNLRGACLLSLGDPERAAESVARAVEAEPGHAHYRSNLGYVLLRDLGRMEAGASHIAAALELDRNSPAIWCNYCSVLSGQGRLDEVISICDQLLAANPALHEARLNRALALLKRQHFEAGWADYAARKLTRSNYRPRPFRYPQWNGAPVTGGAVLVFGEQGIGDEIMFASCLPDVLARTERCVIECSPRLQALFARSFPAAMVRGADQADGDLRWLQSYGQIGFQAAIGDLPGLFRRDPAAFPEHAGYLHADEARVARWKARLAAAPTLNVGIAWRGGMRSTRQDFRSIEPAVLAPLLRTAGVRFVSLQHDADGGEVASMAAEAGAVLAHWPEALADIDETAALVSALDLVISVCSTPVHLSGALGRPVWVLVPAVAEWRYLEKGERMPWYPGARLVRQAAGGDWQTVVQTVARDLAEYGVRSC